MAWGPHEAKSSMALILVMPSPRALLHVKFHFLFIYLMIFGGYPCWVKLFNMPCHNTIITMQGIT